MKKILLKLCAFQTCKKAFSLLPRDTGSRLRTHDATHGIYSPLRKPLSQGAELVLAVQKGQNLAEVFQNA